MPFENPEGPEILPAGEVSVYVMCPEAWRLEYIERVRKGKEKSLSPGEIAHTSWQLLYDEFIYLARSRRILLWLLALLILTGLLLARI